MNRHATEEELVDYHYDPLQATGLIGVHLSQCAVCSDAFSELKSVLALVGENAIVPERSEGYGREVWQRLRWQIGRDKPSMLHRVQPAAAWGSIAATVTIAFLAGTLWQRPQSETLQAPTGTLAGTTISSEDEERLLKAVVGDHLQRSQRVLLDVVNASPARSFEIDAVEDAGDLLAANRLYRQSAERTGATELEQLLTELEPVLIELSHATPGHDSGQLDAVRKRVEGQGILLKLRVVGSQMRGGESRPPAIRTRTS